VIANAPTPMYPLPRLRLRKPKADRLPTMPPELWGANCPGTLAEKYEWMRKRAQWHKDHPVGGRSKRRKTDA
jgi:hypothetical protein